MAEINIPDVTSGSTMEEGVVSADQPEVATVDQSEELLKSFNKVAELCAAHKSSVNSLRNKTIHPHDEARIQGLINVVNNSSEVIDELYKLIVGLNNFYGSQ
jgi:hypothetical protein